MNDLHEQFFLPQAHTPPQEHDTKPQRLSIAMHHDHDLRAYYPNCRIRQHTPNNLLPLRLHLFCLLSHSASTIRLISPFCIASAQAFFCFLCSSFMGAFLVICISCISGAYWDLGGKGHCPLLNVLFFFSFLFFSLSKLR